MKSSEITGTELVIYVNICDALVHAGLNRETARSYSYFAVCVYREVSSRPLLGSALKVGYKAGKGAYPGLKLWYGSIKMAASEEIQGRFLKSAGKAAAKEAGGEMAEFVDVIAGIARAHRIQMNECALAITKVMLDVLASIGMAETVVAVWAAAIQALSTVRDAKHMVQACFAD